MHLLKYRWSRLARNAWRNRQEIIAARLSRRDLLQLGALAGPGCPGAPPPAPAQRPRACGAEIYTPPTRAFVGPLPIPPVKRPLANGAADLTPFPTIVPNNARGEGRTPPAARVTT